MFIIHLKKSLTIRSNLLRSTTQFAKHFSSDDKKSDEFSKNDKLTPKEDKKESAAEKLNRLLASMKTHDDIIIKLTKKVDIPTAGGASSKKVKKKSDENINSDKEAKIDLIEAAKNIANTSIDFNEKKIIESELLMKLLGGNETVSSDNSNTQKNIGEKNLNDLIVGMKIDRKPATNYDPSRSEYVRKTISEKYQQQPNKFKQNQQFNKKAQTITNAGSVNLFNDKEKLNIFQNKNLKQSSDILSTWHDLEQRDLKLLITHPPENYFQKIILWTEQGKFWKFPINNEQNLNIENEVDFSEHIFLEQHLDGWCPTRGPIRHFMELVCVGLSKNPYITAKEKADHILWYRNYFDNKKDILKDLIIASEKSNTEKLEIEKS